MFAFGMHDFKIRHWTRQCKTNTMEIIVQSNGWNEKDKQSKMPTAFLGSSNPKSSLQERDGQADR